MRTTTERFPRCPIHNEFDENAVPRLVSEDPVPFGDSTVMPYGVTDAAAAWCLHNLKDPGNRMLR